MAAPGKINWQKRSRLFEVARLRNTDPGDRGLAAELGITVRAVQYHLRQLRLRISVTRVRSPPIIPRAWLFESSCDAATDANASRDDAASHQVEGAETNGS